MPDATTRTFDRNAPASVTRAAAFRPASYREADNSIEVVWSLGAAGMRYDWTEGFYIEELSMDAKAVRLGRLNAGAALLDSHQAHTLAAVLGSIVPGSARVANGEGVARVRLATTPDVANTNQKIIDGHIRNVSVSYHVFQFVRTEKVGEHPHMLATDWEPTEISMVAVPFDAGAQVRSRSAHMPDVIENNDDTRNDDVPTRRGTVTIARIRELCSRTDDLTRAFERDLLAEHAEEPMTLRAVQERIADELFAVRARDPIDTRASREQHANGTVGGHAQGSPGALCERMAGALYARMSGSAPAPESAEFMSASMVDMMRGMMEARGHRVRWTSASSLVDQMSRGGALTTSDLPNIVGGAIQRRLGELIATDPSPLRAITKRRLASDFRRMMVVDLGNNPALLLVKENGEIKHGAVSDSSEGYALQSYSRIVSLSRQAIINDDLGAFTRIFEGWGRSANDLEAYILTSQIGGVGLKMSDGKPLYDAAHKNVAATGSAITVDSLTAGRLAMRTQTDREGTVLNIAPKYLVVGAAQETPAEQVLATLAAAQLSSVNPFSGKLELIVDARLPGNSWRLFADPAKWPVIEEARLAGQEDVFVDTHVSFEVDGIKTKARVDIAAAAVDWRGTYLNPGQ